MPHDGISLLPPGIHLMAMPSAACSHAIQDSKLGSTKHMGAGLPCFPMSLNFGVKLALAPALSNLPTATLKLVQHCNCCMLQGRVGHVHECLRIE